MISKTDTIEGMTIVKRLGYIEAKPSGASWDPRENARRNLEKKAEELGANAIINYKARDPFGVGNGAVASGDAVIVKKRLRTPRKRPERHDFPLI